MGDFLAGVPPQVQAESRKFVAKLRRRQLQSSEAVAPERRSRSCG